MTGFGYEEDFQRSRDAEFVAHLLKPVEPEELRELLAVLSAGVPA